MAVVTQEQVEILARQGLTQSEIAKKLECSYASVSYICKHNNIKTVAGKKGKPGKLSPDKAAAETIRIKSVVQEARANVTVPEAEIEPRECRSYKMSPAEALEMKLKLPWAGKVLTQTPNELTPDLFDQLMAYGPFTREDICEMFGFKSPATFSVWLKKWGFIEQFFELEESPEPEIVCPIDPSQWDEFRSSPSMATPHINIRAKKSYISAAARAVMGNPAEISVRVSPDGRNIGIKSGGPVRIGAKGDCFGTRGLANMLSQKGLAVPARYLLSQQGEWVIGELEA